MLILDRLGYVKVRITPTGLGKVRHDIITVSLMHCKLIDILLLSVFAVKKELIAG